MKRAQNFYMLRFFRAPTIVFLAFFTVWVLEILGRKTVSVKKLDWQVNFSTIRHCDRFLSDFDIFEQPFDRHLL